MRRARHPALVLGVSLALVTGAGISVAHDTHAKKVTKKIAKKKKPAKSEILWAAVRGAVAPAQPTILRGRGVVKVTRFGAGGPYDQARGFTVRFSRKINKCAYVATVRNGGPGDLSLPLRTAASGTPSRRSIYVTVELLPGQAQYSPKTRDPSFFVAAIC